MQHRRLQVIDDAEDRQAAILNALPAHIALLDADGVIVSVNEAWRRFARTNVLQGPGVGIGRNYLEICDSAAGDASSEGYRVAEGIRSVLDGVSRSYSIEYPCHSPTEQRWFLLTVTPLGDDGSQGAVVMHLDVTAERRLRASELRFRQMAENIRDVFFLKDAQTHRMLYISPAYEEIVGRTCESVYATPHAWTEAIHPDDRAAVRGKFEEQKASGAFEYEYRIVRPDGSIRWIETRGFPVRDDDGRIVRITGVGEDITERKLVAQELQESERRLFVEKERAQVTLACIGDAVACADISGNVTFLNRVAETMTGWSSLEATGSPMGEVFRIVDPASREPILLLPWETDVAGTPAAPSNGVLIRRDGSEIPIEDSVGTIHDRDGQATGAVVVFRDVTQRRAVERLKSEFVSTVSHELRTPLTSIRGALGLLTSGLLGPIAEKGQRMLEIAVINTDRLVRLINDILDLERIESGNVELAGGSVDANTVMVQALESVQSMADQSGVHLAVIPVTGMLWGDSDRIIQTLTNLLGNAIKFSPPDTTVTLSGRAREADFLFCVEDCGRGVPEQNLQSIFGRFSQVNASDSRDRNGSGLGLAICQSIVEAHGGRIWAERNGTAGSRFQFTIPLSASSTAVPPAIEAPPSTAPGMVAPVTDRMAVEEVAALERTSLPPAVWHRAGENLPDAILILDPADETVLDANEKAVNRNGTGEVALRRQVEREVWSWTMTFDAIDAAVLVLDSNGAVLRLNEAARVLAEAPTFSDALGRPVAHVGLGEPWRTFGELSRQAGMAGTLHRTQATDPFSQRIWDVAADSAKGPEGERRTVVVARDITNLVHLESSARRNEVVAEMGRLVVNVAHEVRNPLFGISASVDTLELHIATEDPVVARCVRNLHLEVRRMTALMQDLLDYGKPPALDVTLERSTTPVADAVRGAMLSASTRAVTIENRAADHGSILIDRMRIEQALHNVIQNAVQHSVAGSHVMIHSAVSEIGSDRWLHWSVEDSGPGFSPEGMQSAFEPFYTTRSEGTGLGLSIVRRVVDMHGGRATVENRREGGARVTIALPLQDEP